MMTPLLTFALCALFMSHSAWVKEIEKISFAEEIIVDGEQLKLNGVGLRKVTKFGIPIKVYVAGLYLKEPGTEEEKILQSADVKHLRMVFLRRVDGTTLREAWSGGISANCQVDCDTAKAGLREFNKLMDDVSDKGEMRITFSATAVELDLKGRSAKRGKIENAAFSKAMLAVFIGASPPTPDLKKGLLGI